MSSARPAVRRGVNVIACYAALVLACAAATLQASDTASPQSVTLAGSFQSEAGCDGDWQPECTATRLTYDGDDDVWQRMLTVAAGSWEYKAALNGSWSENYGVDAQRDGADIPLPVAAERTIRFYYDHKTHWITSSANAVIATVPGSFQSELGCPGDWDPGCLRSWLQDPDGDGIYTFATRDLPAGAYEAKVAIDESWDENYGDGGERNGLNIPFSVASAGMFVTFSYDPLTHLLSISVAGAAPQPDAVTVAGSLQSELGCASDWDPSCTATHLAFDTTDLVWQRTFDVPAGDWEFKAALNGSWDENYGRNAERNGANIPLSLGAARTVKFYYDHATHWITSNATSVIAVAPGSFQSELGCPGDWDPGCLRSWLQDPDGDGVYTFSTRALPAGDYEAKVAIDESWAENYGAGGAPNGDNIAFTVDRAGQEIFFSYTAATHLLTISADGAPRGNLRRARAHWVADDTLLWDLPDVGEGWTVQLHTSPDATLALDPSGVQGGTAIPLTFDPSGPGADVTAKFPHLAGLKAFRLDASRDVIAAALRGQLAVSARDDTDAPVDATGLQVPGVLDDLYTYQGELGATFAGTTPTVRVWAPTAQSVEFLLYDTSSAASASAELPMTWDANTGVWSVTGDPSWYGKYYAFRVRVFVRTTGAIETNVVTDPYSVSLSINSARSQLVSLADPAWMPPGWTALVKPRLDAPEDIALYELHVRDFSASDPTVPDALRGTYKAFALDDTAGVQHLASLARAGLTHVHLLPAFDIASVNEDRSTWREPEGDLSEFPPDSPEQQARVRAVSAEDAFNWGYDPWHYNVPDGSYATDPDGAARVLEFREMVAALARRGLRVVMDVVYNHTTASGQNARSVLDRVVPGYYHRLDDDGDVERSTCCENTASEHAMMEKLLIDSVLLFARHYKVDGFRFDLMGHHMKRNMLALRAALDALTPGRDGVDGRSIYVYGEGWNFGEVADGARGENAIQANMAGTGIGTFSDRMRDGVRGGGPFSGLQEQGYLTGLLYDPNGTAQGSPDDQLARLLLQKDWIRVGLAGNLADVRFEDRTGTVVRGREVDYNGQPAGYTADPQEVITYVEAHDNETLFDAIQLKAPRATPMADRVRMQNLGTSLVALAQGVPFFHAGVELLRSKSLDRNSYDSGDWFNRLDFTFDTNNWGVGLPRQDDNGANWPIMAPLLGDAALRPTRADILDAAAHFREVLSIRRSSRLFRMRSAAEIASHLSFFDTGPDQVPGAIGVLLSDDGGSLDRRYRRIAVVFNADPADVQVPADALHGLALRLHPILAGSADPVVRTATFDPATSTFSVPGRTAAVFVAPRPAAQRLSLLAGDLGALVGAGLVPGGPAHGLLATLRAAAAAAAGGRALPAAQQLRAFLAELDGLVRGGQVAPESVAAMRDEAAEIVQQLAGG